eukprot:GHRQ01008686.1.p1 GENE.GHRQ01008686.1~~GHRQ01008686.1.p1  ORF type:complete len:111 (+),score=31.94 GHRQ01008686.1:184-516(+)
MAILQKCNAAFGCTRPQRIRCQAVKASAVREEGTKSFAAVAAAGFTALSLLTAAPAVAEFKLPPISSDPNRCDRGYTGNTIGQVRRKPGVTYQLPACSVHTAAAAAVRPG